MAPPGPGFITTSIISIISHIHDINTQEQQIPKYLKKSNLQLIPWCIEDFYGMF